MCHLCIDTNKASTDQHCICHCHRDQNDDGYRYDNHSRPQSQEGEEGSRRGGACGNGLRGACLFVQVRLGLDFGGLCLQVLQQHVHCTYHHDHVDHRLHCRGDQGYDDHHVDDHACYYRVSI